MTISIVASSTVDHASGQEQRYFILPLETGPAAGVQSGDILLFNAVAAINTVPTMTLPEGAIAISPPSAPPNGTGAGGSYVWVVPSPKPASVTLDWGTARRGSLAWVAFRESDASRTWIEPVYTAAAWEQYGPSTKSTPALASVPDGSVLAIIVQQNSGSAVITTPSGWTRRTTATERQGAILTRNTLKSASGVVNAQTLTLATGTDHRLQLVALATEVSVSALTIKGRISGTTVSFERMLVRQGGVTLEVTRAAIRESGMTIDIL